LRFRIITTRCDIPLESILSIRSERQTFSFSVAVWLYDVVKTSTKLVFQNREIAKNFIVAVRRGNSTILVEQEQWSFFLWW
jgi:hypothetical protein